MDLALLYFAVIFGFSILGYFYETVSKAIRKKPNNTIVSGPYHIIYGVGVAFAFLICSLPFNVWLQFLVIAIGIIAMEYVGGMILNRWLKLGLWDYSKNFLNLGGQICLTVSIAWIAFAALYAFLLHGLLAAGFTPMVSGIILMVSLVVIFIHDLVAYNLRRGDKHPNCPPKKL